MRSWGVLLRLVVGVAAAWLLGWGFVEVGEGISGGLMPSIDLRIVRLVETSREPALTVLMLLLTYLGSAAVCIPISILVAALLWRRRRRLTSIMVLVVMFGSSLISIMLKAAYNRPRPDISPLVKGVFSSFPSGHTVTATAFYGFLTYVAVRDCRWHRKVAAWTVYALLVVAIGFSRIYLGVHWPSDVVGGMLAGAAWLAACISAYEVLRHMSTRWRA